MTLAFWHLGGGWGPERLALGKRHACNFSDCSQTPPSGPDGDNGGYGERGARRAPRSLRMALRRA